MTDFNILKPELLWIKDRCYRKLPIRKSKLNPEEVEVDLYPVQHYGRDDEDEDFGDVDVKHSNNEFWTTISVPSVLKGSIIGKNGNVLRRIENDTRARINVPRNTEKSSEISITGGERWGVAMAYRQIEKISNNARWKQEYTHFVSMPVNFDHLKNSFLEFKKDVLHHRNKVRGLDESIFENPNKLHLTVVMLILLDEREREKAAAVLQKFKEDVRVHLESEPLTVSIRGIEYMNDDPSEVDVLYAKVSKVEESHGEAKLQILANSLLDKFTATGFSKKQQDKVKLHITLMNTRFRDTKEDEGSGRKTFDARFLLEKYGDYNFGIVTLSDIHISVRYTAGTDGYYSSTSILRLPTV